MIVYNGQLLEESLGIVEEIKEDGYFVLGQTGYYGVGNHDVYLTKLDLLMNYGLNHMEIFK